MSKTADQGLGEAALSYAGWVPGERPLVFAQLGGCNLSQIVRLLPECHVDQHALRTSTISLVSEPLDIAHFRRPECPLKAKYVDEDFGKFYARRIFEEGQWDVLFVDCLRDYLMGAIEVGGTYVSEINQWVQGEPLGLDDLFVSPWRRITWQDPGYFDLWSHAAQTLYTSYLKPHLDSGRRVVVHELLPTSGEYNREQLSFVPHPDGRERDSSAFLRRMYRFLADLDPRILLLRVEDGFAIGAFDAENGLFDFHMIADYSERAAQILGEMLGVSQSMVSSTLAANRLKETHRRYLAGFEFERDLHHRLAVAEQMHNAARSELKRAADAANLRAQKAERELIASRRKAEALTDDLAVAHSKLDGSRRQYEADLASAGEVQRAMALELEDLRAAGIAESARYSEAEADLKAAARTANLRAEISEQELSAARHAVRALTDDLAAASLNLDAMRQMRGADAGVIAALSGRLDAEARRAADLQGVFASEMDALRTEITGARADFAHLAAERDALTASFREHILHADALRDELERRERIADENHRMVHDIISSIRRFAEQHDSPAPLASAMRMSALQIVADLSNRLEAASRAVYVLDSAVSALSPAARAELQGLAVSESP